MILQTAVTSGFILLLSQLCIATFLLVTGLYFLFKREKRLHRLLSGILLFWFLLHLKDMLLLNDTTADMNLERLCICIDILAVPSCAFLLFELTSPGWFSWRRAIIHEIPFLVLLGLYGIHPNKVVFYLDISIALIYALYVILQLFRTIPEYNRTLRENFSNTDNLDLEWLWKLLVFFILFLFAWIYSALLVSDNADILYNLTSLVLWSIICCNIHKQQPLVLTETAEPVGTTASETVDDQSRPEFAAALEHLFTEEKIWLNPRLTISEVAHQLGTNRTYLSDYLNRSLKTTFYEFVNEYRVRAVAEQLEVPENSLTIEAIAESCGFNSISTFRRVFIRRFGCTPTRYRLRRGNRRSVAH